MKVYPEGSTEVFQNLPIELLPAEVGGKGRSHFEYSGNIKKNVVIV